MTVAWSSREEIIRACRKEPERVADFTLVLMAHIDELERRLSLTSRDSNKPPSSDGYPKPAPESLRGKSVRPSGGQPGHGGHYLEPRDAPDRVVIHSPARRRAPNAAVRSSALRRSGVSAVRSLSSWPRSRGPSAEHQAGRLGART